LLLKLAPFFTRRNVVRFVMRLIV